MSKTDFLNLCRQVTGADQVITDTDSLQTYESEWRQRIRGKALAAIRPGSTDEVAQIVRLCQQFRVPLVPQGGNTGLVYGSIPDHQGNAVVLSLKRMQTIRELDIDNETITAEAGCLLAQVQQAAADAGKLYPLSLASEGSCTIGGNLSTNAGGTAVLRYGNARELCLGLEVVTANGDIWHGLKGLRKDNTGYDLKNLYIGAEGTLGIITAATLKLFPAPRASCTVLAALATPDAALHLLNAAKNYLGPTLTGFELISDFCLQLVLRHFPQLRHPFRQTAPYYVLLEIASHESQEHAAGFLLDLLEKESDQNQLQDAVVAESRRQAQTLWNLRENISMAQAAEGKNIKHDIAVPVSSIPAFIAETNALLHRHFSGCRIVCFGHMGDGNLHYNISAPEHTSGEIFLKQQALINRIVHDQVHRFNGSISAEHGLGTLKKEEIRRYKSAIELNLMETIKAALDPHNLMNPGKVL
ncbi:FAD-binding oxidoreductase [Undibacterium oligocarboniphilum]|uniref:FAD-binding oxidoreductase n=1 Tax=Undibacterium oligocarboniphilum TaxID=666702 RepID=A0A850QMZ8_9BURK|nr:FAD-binding oxidoreductase [Undibacterium oligocarboniphilum]MBC3870099.1 FAD-binding oxidoreductase [Undibacterium oligocarboniphilum]NVO78090.1 FAD-binding oxidoreductase [Undibacterium oligocarboniphilum]